MEPFDFEGRTNILGAPSDWDEARHGRCEGLPIVRGEEEPGLPTMKSYWRPNEADIAVLLAGGAIELCLFGVSHPPVWVAAVPDNKVKPR